MNAAFQPLAPGDRIQLLDVIRGFALLGIFMMNVEFFNRPVADLGAGLATGVNGIDEWAGWFVHVFVRGKFWTMFSLLFGMGFAVMAGRAEQAGRVFLAPYARRTLALAAFGVLHFILIWAGDILFSYAVAAVLLMVVVHARPKPLLLAAGLALGVAMLLGAFSGLVKAAAPWQPFALLAAPLLLLAAIAATLRRWPLTGLRHAGLVLYLLPFLAMALGGLVQLRQPPQAERDRIAMAAASTPAERAALRTTRQARAQAERETAQLIAEETRVMRSGSYAHATALRGHEFVRHLGSNAVFSMIALGMFLLGAWAIRSGVMIRPEQHQALFRGLAWVGLPLGLGLGVFGAWLAPAHVPGVNDAAYQFATGLTMLGNLPACLGYVAVLVLAWQGGAMRWLRCIAPAGRMALSNYLLQSVVGTLFFYGYGLGHWGLGRAWQLVFVLVVFGLQVVLSGWWLARFSHGPVEWLWRWVTYGRRPALRRA